MGRLDMDFAANFTFGDEVGLKAFALAHRLAHDQFADAIAENDGIDTPDFDVADSGAHGVWAALMLDAKEVTDEARQALEAWLVLHQQLHQAEYDATALGVAYDFSTVDFADQEEFYTWMQQHQQAHAITADALGITT